MGLQLTEGLQIVVYDEELEAFGNVTFSEEERVWVAEIDWDKVGSGK
jgi:hypothetical protein